MGDDRARTFADLHVFLDKLLDSGVVADQQRLLDGLWLAAPELAPWLAERGWKHPARRQDVPRFSDFRSQYEEAQVSYAHDFSGSYHDRLNTRVEFTCEGGMSFNNPLPIALAFAVMIQRGNPGRWR